MFRWIARVGLITVTFLWAHQASSDTYRRESYSFELPGLSLKQVQEAVVANLTGQSGSLVWDRSLCYRVAKGDLDDRQRVDQLVSRLNAEVPLDIRPCPQNADPVIIFYFSQGKFGADDRAAIRALAGNPSGINESLAHFVEGSAGCYWDFRVDVANQPYADLGITISGLRNAPTSGLVAVNTAVSNAADSEKCLFLGAVSVFGLAFPLGAEPAYSGKIDQKTEDELTLLSLFVLYVVAEDGRGWSSGELAAKIRSILFVMHELGK